MRKDQIFVLMLVIFLPLTGCFGDAIGEAEAEDSDDTTVINNYYYNNTTIVESDNSEPEYFVVGGTVDNNTSYVPRVGQDGAYYYPYNFSTTSGQTVYIHNLMKSSGASSVSLISDCGEGGVWSVSNTQTDYAEHHNGYWVPGSAYDCQHSVKLLGGVSPFGAGMSQTYQPPYYFSMVYSIENMTVMPL